MLHGCRYYNHAVQSCTKVHFGHHIRSGGGECLGGRPGRAGWLVQWCKCSRAKQQPVRASGRRARAANQRGSLFQCSQRAARRTTAYQIRVSQMQSSRPHPSSLRRLNNDEARAFLETRDYHTTRNVVAGRSPQTLPPHAQRLTQVRAPKERNLLQPTGLCPRLSLILVPSPQQKLSETRLHICPRFLRVEISPQKSKRGKLQLPMQCSGQAQKRNAQCAQ